MVFTIPIKMQLLRLQGGYNGNKKQAFAFSLKLL
jgi:hypothetical protein